MCTGWSAFCAFKVLGSRVEGCLAGRVGGSAFFLWLALALLQLIPLRLPLIHIRLC